MIRHRMKTLVQRFLICRCPLSSILLCFLLRRWRGRRRRSSCAGRAKDHPPSRWENRPGYLSRCYWTSCYRRRSRRYLLCDSRRRCLRRFGCCRSRQGACDCCRFGLCSDFRSFLRRFGVVKKDLKGVFCSLHNNSVGQHLCQFIVTHLVSDLQAHRFSLSTKEGTTRVDNRSKLVVVTNRCAV